MTFRIQIYFSFTNKSRLVRDSFKISVLSLHFAYHDQLNSFFGAKSCSYPKLMNKCIKTVLTDASQVESDGCFYSLKAPWTMKSFSHKRLQAPATFKHQPKQKASKASGLLKFIDSHVPCTHDIVPNRKIATNSSSFLAFVYDCIVTVNVNIYQTRSNIVTSLHSLTECKEEEARNRVHFYLSFFKL